MIDIEELKKLPFKEKKELQKFVKFTDAEICIRCKHHQKHFQRVKVNERRYKNCLEYMFCQIGGFTVLLGSTCDLFEPIGKDDIKNIRKM